MKREYLIKHLLKHGCNILREGKKHTIVINKENFSISSIPRHNEIKDTLCNEICKQLGIAKVK